MGHGWDVWEDRVCWKIASFLNILSDIVFVRQAKKGEIVEYYFYSLVIFYASQIKKKHSNLVAIYTHRKYMLCTHEDSQQT